MTFREWLRDARCEGERRQALFLGIVVAVALVGVVILGALKQCQMERERALTSPGGPPAPAISTPSPADEAPPAPESAQ
ncbi:MAG: hypothetical protein N2322_04720 [Terrimicrobiaceae bacterium]|nr:hypothetical protein [Terrimicrobiaceae bacterium]